MDIGLQIRRRRKQLKMTVEELAEKVKVQPFTVYRWEQGKNTPKPEMLESIASALNCSVSVILEPKGSE